MRSQGFGEKVQSESHGNEAGVREDFGGVEEGLGRERRGKWQERKEEDESNENSCCHFRDVLASRWRWFLFEFVAERVR